MKPQFYDLSVLESVGISVKAMVVLVAGLTATALISVVTIVINSRIKENNYSNFSAVRGRTRCASCQVGERLPSPMTISHTAASNSQGFVGS